MHVFDAKGPRSGMVKASQRAALNVTDDTGREPQRGIKSYRKAVLQQVPRVSKRLPVLFFILFFSLEKVKREKSPKFLILFIPAGFSLEAQAPKFQIEFSLTDKLIICL